MSKDVFGRQELNLGDLRFSYRSCGHQGPQLVLLHGISSGAASWSACAQALEGKARVLAWDAPGYGSSSPLPDKAPNATAYAQRLALLLDALDIESCVLVGHSLGVLMAAAFAQLHAARLRALMLFSPALGYGGGERAQAVRTSRLAGLSLGIAAIANKLPARLLSADATAEQQQQLRQVALGLHADGYTQAVEMLCAEDLFAYKDLPPLTQVHCGEHDIVTTPEQSRAYALQQGLPFSLIAGAGHACHVEQPAAVASLIAQVLAQVESSSSGTAP